MGELVSDDVERNRKTVEQPAVAIAKHHLLAVPERIVVAAAIMHRRVERHTLVVDRLPIEDLEIEIPGRAQPVEGLRPWRDQRSPPGGSCHWRRRFPAAAAGCSPCRSCAALSRAAGRPPAQSGAAALPLHAATERSSPPPAYGSLPFSPRACLVPQSHAECAAA